MKTATQVKDHIKNLAREKRIDPLLLMKNYMMERFLERISLSPYREKFILKGGLLIAAYVGVSTRTTQDIDTTIKGIPLNEAHLRQIIEEICLINCSDHITFSIKRMDAIHEEGQYPGIRVGMESQMDQMKIPMKLDITTGDVITPKEINYSFPLIFENRSIPILAYNLETLLAEKFETVIDRAKENTRMRDFYDLFLLWQLYQNEIDSEILADAIQPTAKSRGTLKNLPVSSESLKILFQTEALQNHWLNYQKKNNYAKKVNWNDVQWALEEMNAAVVSVGIVENVLEKSRIIDNIRNIDEER